MRRPAAYYFVNRGQVKIVWLLLNGGLYCCHTRNIDLETGDIFSYLGNFSFQAGFSSDRIKLGHLIVCQLRCF